MRRLLIALLGVGLACSGCAPWWANIRPRPPVIHQCVGYGHLPLDCSDVTYDPRDTNHDGYVDCEEDPAPDPVTDLPCGFRDGIPVGSP